MKKIYVFLSFLLAFAATSYGQRATVMPLAAGDTVVNTGTSAKVFTATAGYGGVAVQAKVSLISGTGAGTLGLYGSLDGTNYVQIGSNYTITNTATQSTIFYVSTPLPVYIKVLATGAGTEQAVITVSYVLRKYQVTY